MSSDTRLVLWQPIAPSLDAIAHHCSKPQDFSSFALPILASLKAAGDLSFDDFFRTAVQALDTEDLNINDLDALIAAYSSLGISSLQLFREALAQKNEGLCLALLQNGKVDLRDEEIVKKAMIKALVNKNFAVFKVLARLKPALVSEIGLGQTPLFRLCQLPNDEAYEMVEFLLTLGVNLNGPHSVSGETLLEIAIKYENYKLARLLIRNGAIVNLNLDGKKTLLHLLCDSITNDKEAVELARDLLDAGLNVNAKDSEGSTALMLACKNNNCPMELFYLLCERGAKVNGANKNKQTALSLACDANCFPKVRYLVRHGANIQAEGSDNRTVLKRAYVSKDVKLIAALLGETEDHASAFIADFPLRHRLVHVNSLKYPAWETYEGASGLEMQKEVLKLLEALPETLSTHLTTAERDTLTQAFKAGLTPPTTEKEAEDLADAIKSKKLVKIPIGYKGHAMYLIIGNEYMSIINRGGGASAKQTVWSFKINSTAITKDIVQKIIAMKDSESAVSLEYYLKTLPETLSPRSDKKAEKNAVCTRLEQLSLCEQKNGNCPWASSKGALRLGAAHLRITETSGVATLSSKDMDDAESFSHLFSTFARMKTLSDYEKAHPDPSKDPLCDQLMLDASKSRTLSHISKTPTKAVLETYLKLGLSPLDLFVHLLKKRKSDQIVALIENGFFDLEKIGQQALFITCEAGNIEVAEALLKAKPALANARDDKGNSPLIITCSCDRDPDLRKQLIELLLTKGSDVNHANNEGKTALMAASFCCTATHVKQLLDAGASVGSENQEGDTALFFACANGDVHECPDIVDLLLKAKPDVDHANKKGETALMKVCLIGGRMIDLAEKLLEAGANIALQDSQGNSALSCLCQTPVRSGQGDFLRLLIEYKAPVNLANKAGQTSLKFAKKNPVLRKDFIDLLIKNGALETV